MHKIRQFGCLMLSFLIFSGCPFIDTDNYIFSDFNTDSDGWTVTGDGTNPPTYVPTGGINDSGYISSTDLGITGCWYFSAPEKFQNNISRFLNGRMHFYLTFTSDVTATLECADVIITGGSATMVHDFSHEPVDGVWTEYEIGMSDLFWKSPQGNYLTNDEINDILADVQRIEIRGEYIYGADTGGLDDFYFHEL